MIEHSRITSGYDYEILMGGEYFLAVMQATYYAGDLPRNVTFGGVTVLFESPSAVEVLPLGSATDLTVTVPYSAAGVDGEVLLQITLTTDKRDAAIEITSAFVGLDEATESILTSLGVLDEARDFLRTALDRTFTIKGGEVPVWQVVSRRVPADGDYQAAWGLYVNKEYFTSPPPGPPEEKDDFIPRGDVAAAQSFLPRDSAFVLGASSATYRRLAANKWHSWAEKNPDGSLRFQPDGSLRHPLDGAPGEYRSVNVVGTPGLVTVAIKAEAFIDNWFDADVTIRYEARPRVRDGALDIEVKLAEFDADAGLLGDLIAAFAGAFVGIGVVGGIVVYELVENSREDEGEEKAKSRTDEITKLFEAIPRAVDVGTSRSDPFYELVHWVAHRYREANVNADGMSYAATPDVVASPRPVAVELVDKTRGEGAGSFAGLTGLVYRIIDLGVTQELPMAEVLRRILAGELAKVMLQPSAVRRKNTIITELKFTSGVSFSVSEAIALQQRGVIAVVGCQLIRPRGKRPYFRDAPDADPSNNLESLPRF